VVAGQADILIGANNGAAAKVEPAGLEVRVQVGLTGCISECAVVLTSKVVDLPVTSYECAKEST
jgi:hypothetical protein